MNIIRYNNQNIPYPTPFVTLNQGHTSFNRNWGKDTTINLEGQLTGDYENIRKSQSGLLDIFNQNFGNFEIYEATGATGYNLNRSGTLKPSTNYFQNLTGVYVPKNSNIIVKISGNYGGYPIWFYRGTLSNYFLDYLQLYKINYYSGASETVFPQPLPYTGFVLTASHTIPSYDKYIDPTYNAKGIYSGNIGNYNYISFASFGGGGGSPIVRVEVNALDAEKIYEKSGIIIRSINFNESPYATLLGYNIELNSLEFSGNVTDPKNEFSFTENKDKSVTLNHSISARGLNTNTNSYKSNALQNAIDFVKTYTGLNNIPTLKFISGVNSRNFYLQNFSESIDRLNGTYSIEEEYQASLLNTGLSGNLSYTINIDSGVSSNFLQINIRGGYKGAHNGDINQLRNSLNITSLITGSYSGYFNPTPLQYNISENTGENSISFDYSFDNIDLPNPYFKYSTSVSRNALEQVCNVQVQGEMIARGNLKYRSSLINSNISNLTNSFLSIATGALSGFKDLNNLTINSPLRFKNMTINKNINEGKLTATADYDDKYMPAGYFLDSAYSVSIEAPYWYMNNVPTCNVYGRHIINDFDITTLPKLNMNVNAKMNIDSAVSETTAKIDIKNITKNIIPTVYDFNVKLKENENVTKKYYNLNSVSEISYNLNKVATKNENDLLPKFNSL